MQDGVLGVDVVIAVQTHGDVGLDAGIGRSAFQDADEGAALLRHAEHGEVAPGFADDFAALRTVVPAVEVGVVAVLGKLAVVVADDGAAALGHQHEALFILSGRAEHGQHGNGGDRIFRTVADLLIGHFDHEIAVFQTVNHRHVKDRARVFVGAGSKLLVQLVIFLGVARFLKVGRHALFGVFLGVRFEHVELLVGKLGIHGKQLVLVVRRGDLVRLIERIVVGHLAGVLAHGLGKGGKTLYGDDVGNKVDFLDLPDGIDDAHRAVGILGDLVGAVLDRILVVVKVDRTAGGRIGDDHGGLQHVLVFRAGDRIGGRVFRGGAPDTAGSLLRQRELGGFGVHFKQELVVLHGQGLFSVFIIGDLRRIDGFRFLRGVQRNPHKNDQQRDQHQGDQPGDQTAKNRFFFHLPIPSFSLV